MKIPHLVRSLTVTPLLALVVSACDRESHTPHTRDTAAVQAIMNLKPDHEILMPHVDKVFTTASPEVIRDVLVAVASQGEKAVPGMIRMMKYKRMHLAVARVTARLCSPAPSPGVKVPRWRSTSQSTTRRSWW